MSIVKNIALIGAILGSAFLSVILMQQFFDPETIAPMIFVLAVFLISQLTQGYLYGIVSALVSVLAVNFAFTFPYFEFTFTVPETVFSELVMLFVAIMTSTLTTNLKRQERMHVENEKEKMRANLLRAISHDLRTPLTSIYGSCSTIVENYDSLDKAHQVKLLEEVCSDTLWLNRMVENLLSVTRVGNGTVSLQKTSTVLEELIESVFLKFQKHYPAQPLTVDIPDAFISIPMDSLLIEQVLINLLENAVCHATGMTRLTLHVFTRKHQAVFEVADDGCGMSKETIAQVFAGDSQKKDACVAGKRRGMGIGLSVCNAIIRAHGGELQINSTPGHGTKILFSLEMEDSSNDE